MTGRKLRIGPYRLTGDGRPISPSVPGYKINSSQGIFSQLSQISNLLQVMRMDMTNYAIRQIRPLVQKQHIEQQREYFEKWAQGKSSTFLWTSLKNRARFS